ncbi:hypothetical protein KQX54_004841 [Cotesia glomerata]|uniref:Uncharacterized protein n=1 Tax=Cotesia glomerata TaxID=32391 RepID=A0AAV7IWS3_COTGL|nr:hypothetical protein KQX54_004841 [Cotesia glomerata]
MSYDINICKKNVVSIKAYEAEKLLKDRDGIIFSTEYDTEFKVTMSFYGSPLICDAVDNSQKKYLFGISIFDAEVTYMSVNRKKFTPTVKLIGSYFNIVDNYYQLQAKIYEAKKYIKNHKNSQLTKYV